MFFARKHVDEIEILKIKHVAKSRQIESQICNVLLFCNQIYSRKKTLKFHQKPLKMPTFTTS